MKRSHGVQSGKSRLLRSRKLSAAAQLREFDVGSAVKIAANPRFRGMPPLKFNNRIARVIGRQGNSYVLEVNDKGKSKNLVVSTVHLVKAS